MLRTESIVPPLRDATLTCFPLRLATARHVGELVPLLREVGHGPQLAPGEPASERESFGEVVLIWRLRNALLRVDCISTPSHCLVTLWHSLLAWLRCWGEWRGAVQGKD